MGDSIALVLFVFFRLLCPKYGEVFIIKHELRQCVPYKLFFQKGQKLQGTPKNKIEVGWEGESEGHFISKQNTPASI